MGDPWRLVLWNTGLLIVAVVLLWLNLGGLFRPAELAQALIGVVALLAWLTAMRFVLLDSWGRIFWLILWMGSLVLVLTLGEGGVVAGVSISGFVLAFRQYQPWRIISPRRRALGFGLGLVSIVVIFLLRRFWDLAPEDSPVAVFRNLGAWSLGSLLFFWAWSLFHLAIRMRLHFLRLRPKLAVSAVLIGLVPLLLVVVLGLMILYTGLGGARAARTVNTLESWRAMADEGADLRGALFDTTFVWPETAAAGHQTGRIPAPERMEDLARLIKGRAADEARLDADSSGVSAPLQADTTGWYLIDERIWLMRWTGLDGPDPAVEGWYLGHKPLKKLSGLLKAGIDIGSIGTSSDEDGDLVVGPASEEDRESFAGIEVGYREITEDNGYWNKFFYFGGTLFSVLLFDEDGLDSKTLFINLRVGWQDLKTEFLEGDSNLNIAVVVALGLMAFLFLVLEIFAFFFGVRISEGIVSAVHMLHRGTRQVAAGNLDTMIDIPNEDEFGDLAASFNDMTRAVKQGREIALANEALRQELETARAIQVRLLPTREPVLEGFEVTGASIPSREIGGDYFDFIAQGDDKIGIAIGDVSGKGMPAALLMSNLQASLHGQVLHPGSVSGVVQRVNDLIVKSTDPHMFATFFYGLLDVLEGTLTCTNAGHNPPLLLRADGTIEELTTGGLLLGMVGEQVYQQETVQLNPGEIVVMYTDGITEAVGPGADEEDPDSMFGEEALQEVLKANRHLPAAAIKEAILEAVARHTAGEAQSDDITLVVIRRQG